MSTVSGSTATLHELLQLPASAAARHIVAYHMEEAVRAFERLQQGADPEALHDFRVALRRLRTTAREYRQELKGIIGKSILADVQNLARATGPSRDLEVQIAWIRSQETPDTPLSEGARWLLARLEAEERAAFDASLQHAIDGWPLLLERLRTRFDAIGSGPSSQKLLEPRFGAAFGRRIRSGLNRLEKRLDAVRSRDDVDRAHRARIAGKRLRYVLEPVSQERREARPLVKRLKRLQDSYGDMRDARLLRERIARELQRAQEADLALPGGASHESPDMQTPNWEERAGLLALMQALRKQEIRSWQRARRGWSEETRRAFFRRARSLAILCGAEAELGMEDVEIERKYLLGRLPPRARAAEWIEIEQGWLPGRKLAERLRRARTNGRNSYYRTMKLGAGVRRTEVEERTTREVFDTMWPLTEGKRVRKRRYRVPDGELVWEIDEFIDRDLVLAEVELPRTDIVPVPPRWLKPYVVRDVTDEPEFVNINLAR